MVDVCKRLVHFSLYDFFCNNVKILVEIQSKKGQSISGNIENSRKQ